MSDTLAGAWGHWWWRRTKGEGGFPSSVQVLGTPWPVVIAPDADRLGYCYAYPPSIVLREPNERVLLHEVLHAAVVMHPNGWAIAEVLGAAFNGAQEGLVSYLTGVLYDAGYRLRSEPSA